jgi:hypothetical protein
MSCDYEAGDVTAAKTCDCSLDEPCVYPCTAIVSLSLLQGLGPSQNEYPLYWRGVDQKQFASALRLLTLNVIQVQSARAHASGHRFWC